jgi:hypothetical protein
MALITSLNDILPHMRPELPGCDEPVVLAALRRASVEFCNDSESYVYRHDLTVVPDQASYSIALTNFQTKRIKSIRMVDSLSTVTDDTSGSYIDVDEYRLSTTTADTLVFEKNYIPSSAYAGYHMALDAVKIPHELTDALPDMYLNEWLIGIKAGAMSHLMMTEGKPWFNATMAAKYAGMYQEYVLRARYEEQHKNKTQVRKVSGGFFVV